MTINYNDNPLDEPQVWDTNLNLRTLSGTKTHFPCGHWHKRIVPTGPQFCNIYRLTDPWFTTGSIQSIFFHKKAGRLYCKGYYISDTVLGGLIATDDCLVTIAGTGNNTKLVKLDYNLNIISEHAIFSYYDSLNVTNHRLEWLPEKRQLYFAAFAYDYVLSRLIVIDYDTMSIVGRYGLGVVIKGTDDNLYMHDTGFNAFSEARIPITGLYWSTFWTKIADGLHDGPVFDPTGAEVEPYRKFIGSGVHNNIAYYAGRLYQSSGQSTAHCVKTYNPIADFHPIAMQAPTMPYSLFVDNSGVYVGGGHGNFFYIEKYSHSLGAVQESKSHSYGRILQPYAISATEDYIVVGTTDYTKELASVLLLSKYDLSVVNRFDLNAAGMQGAQCVTTHENYVFVGTVNYIAVFYIYNAELIPFDYIKVAYTGNPEIGYSSLRIVAYPY